jgi:hypothetical protein
MRTEITTRTLYQFHEQTIIVEAWQDSMGSIIVEPISESHRLAYAAHMRGMTGRATCQVYIQEGMGAEEFINEDCPPRHRADLRNGYTVRFRLDPWVYGMMLGYDAQEVSL